MPTAPLPARLCLHGRAIGIRTIWTATALACAAFAVVILNRIRESMSGGQMPLNDFFAFWCFAKYAWAQGAQGIYDPVRLHDFMQSLDDSLRQHFPYPYPPSFLLMIWPLGLLTQRAAYFAWMSATWGLYLLASYARTRPWQSLLVGLAPAAMINLYLGQTGFLSSALMIGGLRLMGRRPAFAGILLGLLSFKPQLGLLLPIALVAAAQWRTALSATGTTVLLVVVSGIVFGWSPWSEWLAMLPHHSRYAELAVNNHYKPTVIATLEMAGLARGIAHAAQGVAALLVGVLVWICFRRGTGALPLAGVAVGTFLATPYAFFYDLPMLTNATLAEAFEQDQTPGTVQTSVLALSLLFPIAMLMSWRLWWVPLPAIALLFSLIIRRVLRSEHPPGTYSAAIRPAASQSSRSARARTA